MDVVQLFKRLDQLLRFVLGDEVIDDPAAPHEAAGAEDLIDVIIDHHHGHRVVRGH